MIKCDFCTNSVYKNGSIVCREYSYFACEKAAKLLAQVAKSQNQQTRTVNKNINKTYKNR